MLVLSRKRGERIMVGDDIVITVVHAGDTVRLGIEAPRDVKVIREELVGQPPREKQSVAKS